MLSINSPEIEESTLIMFSEKIKTLERSKDLKESNQTRCSLETGMSHNFKKCLVSSDQEGHAEQLAQPPYHTIGIQHSL